MHILIVEDERKLAEAVLEGLQANGYIATIAPSGEVGVQLVRKQRVDLVLLDIKLPRQSGLETLRELRREGFKVPVLILTSKDTVDDRVLGLDAGADDYLIKPFAFPELLARIRALLRRGQPTAALRLELADLSLDVSGRIARRDGKVLDLTSREFDLLEYLLLNRGTVVSREMLARDVWKETSRYTSIANVIDVQVARLRTKVDEPFTTRLLHTVRGVGFVLREEQN
jgi:two-component system, OmpR family, copper resistance phosphate regulon response regulator CusR